MLKSIMCRYLNSEFHHNQTTYGGGGGGMDGKLFTTPGKV